MRVAVLGAGLTGVCAALELAERGCEVDLIEQSDTPISRASYWNEGKLHLGFVYAMDRSLRTARKMIGGAIRFRPLLERWITREDLDAAVSEPFDYAVHRDSMVSVAALEQHFERVSNIYADERRATGGAYVVVGEGPLWRPLSPSERRRTYDDELVVAAYRTQECAIDPQRVARALRTAVAQSPRLNFHAGMEVVGMEIMEAAKVQVCTELAGQRSSATYSAAINALWQNRLGVDASAGVKPPRNVLHRYKVGLHSQAGQVSTTLPTTTFVIGPFGDVVNFGGRSYMCWYPAGHLFSDRSIVPAPCPAGLEPDDHQSLIDSTISALGRLMPRQRDVLLATRRDWTVAGGFITAWGETGIDDPNSTLHERHQIGVRSCGPLHSVDTGKYTTAPLFAHLACRRVLRGAAAA